MTRSRLPVRPILSMSIYQRLRHRVRVNRLCGLILLGALSFSAGPAFGEHTRARLVPAADLVRPGDTVLMAVPLHMDAGWHTYWKNPGESGMATTIQWVLPPGITAGEIQWPAPEKMSEGDLTIYVYTNDATLLVPLKFAPDLPPGSVTLLAKLSWLECEVQCVPGSATVQTTLKIGAETRPSPAAADLPSWQKNIPAAENLVQAVAWWEQAPNGNARPLAIQWQAGAGAGQPDFYPDASDDFEIQAATETVPAEPGKMQIRKVVKKSAPDWPGEISGLLIQKTGAERQAYQVKLRVAPTPPAAGTAAGTVAKTPALIAVLPLWKILLYAFLGGLILNVMPCVLPVIALKILGFVGQAKDDARRVRYLGLIYALGVLVSFLALAGLVIGVKAAGHSAGWGMQFGNPQFLVGLTVLVTLVALNLFGLFEIQLGGNVMGAAGELASKHGAAGAFFNGVLATILATPCTAPFLGAALGFAFTQSAPFIVLVFLVVGLGLAAPYVVLSWQPAWLKFLPKSGAWMIHFKVAMGFPMLLTAVWLLSLVPRHFGDRSSWLAFFLVVVAMAAWAYGEFVQRRNTRRGLALALVLTLLAGDYWYVLERQLHWRNAGPESPLEQASTTTADGIAWQPWSAENVARARAEGHPVLVDFTADWCLTCQVNKKLSIEIPQVQARIKQLQVTALLGDYTKTPETITAELNRYGRVGVPLVLIFPADLNRPPVVLPEVLTPGIVLSALDQVAATSATQK